MRGPTSNGEGEEREARDRKGKGKGGRGREGKGREGKEWEGEGLEKNFGYGPELGILLSKNQLRNPD